MDKLKILNRIKELYNQNHNIIKFLKETDNRNNNTLEDILISYDFQAGTYIKEYKESPQLKDRYSQLLAEVIDGLGSFQSIVEAGIGEATTLGTTVKKLTSKPDHIYGFDISWSRVKYAKKFLRELGLSNVNVFTADLFNIPLKDNSIDVVYTSHSIEPNGGKEKEALKELYRITNKYLILLEPAYELAHEEARHRMLEHGYVTELYSSAKALDFDVVEHRLFGVSANPLNPTGIMVIKKKNTEGNAEPNPLCCPMTKAELSKFSDAYFSQDSLLAYPIIGGVPCLLAQNAIIATKFLDNFE